MIKKITALAFVLTAGYIATDNAYTYRDQPPPVRTAAPNEGSCASSGCHDDGGGLNTGTGNISIRLVNKEAFYKTDSSYLIEVKVEDVAKTRFGFELTALDENHNPAGSFVRTNNSNTVTSSGSVGGKSRKYISHLSAGSNTTWQFKWKAPATMAGTVTFYGIGNAANGDGGDANDLIYTNTLEFPSDTNSSTSISVRSTYLNCCFQASDRSLYINQQHLGNNASLKVFDLSGKLVLEAPVNANNNSIPMGNLTEGIYVVQLVNGQASASAKIFINN